MVEENEDQLVGPLRNQTDLGPKEATHFTHWKRKKFQNDGMHIISESIIPKASCLPTQFMADDRAFST